MRLKKCLSLVLMSLFCLGAALPAAAADLVKVPTAWLPGQEAFPIWYAKQQGWDKAAGIDLQIYAFDSGADALRAFPAKSWIFGGLGAVPAMLGALRYNMSVIGLGNDEAMANAVMVRADSPILKTKGYNKEYPNIYGSPESVRGVNWLQTAPREEVVKQFQKFYLDWAGQDYSTDLINLNFDTYEFFNLEAQKKLFSTSAGPSQVQQWQSELAEFFASVGLITEKNLKEIQGSSYVTSKYIDMVTPQAVAKQ